MKPLMSFLILLLTAGLSACQLTPERPTTASTAPERSQKPPESALPPKQAVETATKPSSAAPVTNNHSSAAHTPPPPQDALALLQQNMQWGENLPAIALSYKRHAQRHPKHVRRVFNRAKWFLPHIIQQLQAQNMPLELALLPYVESGFNPAAHSWQGAAGIWQFTRATGLHMGLKINWWYDARRDLEASTAAALKYLNYLYQKTGDWYLALAAYNAGLGNVFRAKRYYARKHNGKKPTSFWQIRRYLPGETQNYVPALLGMIAYLKEADLSTLPKIPLTSPVAKLSLTQQTDLNKMLHMSGVDQGTFHFLNAAYLRQVTPPDGPHHLYLPHTALAKIAPLLEKKPTLFALKLQRYKIRNGDSLSVIAHRFGTTTRHLMRLNRLKTPHIRAGKTLLVPATRTYTASHTAQPARKKQGMPYRVKKGETLWDIAIRYNLKTRALAQYNGLSVRQPLRVGQLLYIPVKHKQSAAKRVTKQKLTHTVKPGESLWLVAKRYGATVKALRRWNDLPARFTLRPGQKLVVWTTKTNTQQDS